MNSKQCREKQRIRCSVHIRLWARRGQQASSTFPLLRIYLRFNVCRTCFTSVLILGVVLFFSFGTFPHIPRVYSYISSPGLKKLNTLNFQNKYLSGALCMAFPCEDKYWGDIGESVAKWLEIFVPLCPTLCSKKNVLFFSLFKHSFFSSKKSLNGFID